jgi:hypothetical protein
MCSHARVLKLSTHVTRAKALIAKILMMQTGYEATHTIEIRNAFKIVFGNPEWKGPLLRLKCR